MSNALLQKSKGAPAREPFRPQADGAPGPAAGLASALREWTEALGERAVETGDAILSRYARTTSSASHRPLAILCPTSTNGVQRALQIAARHGVGVHPISRGKNWGYGDACPPGPDQVVMDLGRMNQILEVNADLAYAVIEPGVTQEQLYRHLQDHNIPLWMDSSGAGREASLVGNILERGFGHTRYGDRILSVCGMEVVLGDGRILNTGFGHYSNAKSHRTYRYGIGPFLDGIFSQSNYGVVTRMGIWLLPEPEDFCAFLFSTPIDSDLPAIIDALAPLRMQGILQSTIHVANDLRAISGRMSYPWDRAGGRTPLPQDIRAQLRREFMLGAWNGLGALYGTRETVAAARKVVARALRPFKPTFLNDRKLKFAGRLQRALGWTNWGRRMGERLRVVEPVYDLLWASTSTKDPAFPDTYYLGKLAAPDTIDTVPEKTLLAFADHGGPVELMGLDYAGAERCIADVSNHGVDVDALGESLQRQGARAFEADWATLLDAITAKAKSLRKVDHK